MAEAVAAWAAAVAGGGEAVLGEAAAGDWAEAGSSGVAAWLVHTGACSIGVLMRRPRKTTGQGRHSAGGGAVGAAEAGWAEVTSLTVNRAGSSRRPVPRLRERAPPQPRTPRRKGSDHRADHRNIKNILKPPETPLHDSPFSTCKIKTVRSKRSLNYQPSLLPNPVFLLLSLFPL